MQQEFNPGFIEPTQLPEFTTSVETLDVDAEFTRLTDSIDAMVDAETREQLASRPQRKNGSPPEKGWGYPG